MTNLQSLYESNQHHLVINSFEKNNVSIQSDPLSSQLVAASYFQLGQYRDAFNILEQIYSSFSDNSNFLSLYAATCRHLGRTADAQRYFAKALEIDPSNPTLRNNYSNLLIDLQKYDEAHSILLDLVSSDPEYQDAKSNLSRLENIIELTNQSSDPISDSLQGTTSLVSNNDSADKDFVDPLMFAFSEDEVQRAVSSS